MISEDIPARCFTITFDFPSSANFACQSWSAALAWHKTRSTTSLHIITCGHGFGVRNYLSEKYVRDGGVDKTPRTRTLWYIRTERDDALTNLTLCVVKLLLGALLFVETPIISRVDIKNIMFTFHSPITSSYLQVTDTALVLRSSRLVSVYDKQLMSEFLLSYKTCIG